MTTMAEPEWDQATRDLVLGYDAVDICPSCHGPAYLCQDPERQDDWVAADPIRCHKTTALLQRQATVTEETNPQSQALLWSVSLRERRPPVSPIPPPPPEGPDPVRSDDG